MGVLDFFNFPDVDYRTTAPRRAVGLLNRDPTETPLSVSTFNATKDFVPVLGDVLAFGEAGQALSEGDRQMAAILAGSGLLGLVPGAGDALASGVKTAARGAKRGFDTVVDAGVRSYDPTVLRSGFGPIPETPAQEIARLLREGRASEVTDDLYAAADPQELHRLYEGGTTGADMPMDTTSRMARAAEMGFDTGTPLYHGGDGFGLDVNFKYPAPVYVADEPFEASEYALDRGGDDAQVAPLVARMGKIADGDEVLRVWEEVSGRSRDGLDYQFGWVPLNDTYSDHTSQVHQGLLDRGYDTAYFDDDFTPDGEVIESYALLNPVSNIRSRFARFDPRLTHLRNLSSGVAGAGAVGLGLLSQQPSQSEVEQYLTERGLLQ